VSAILSSLACNLDRNILQAALPLFASEKVEAIEWSFDTLYKVRNIPDWFVQLLMEYSQAGRLIGHGVYFSLFSGRWTPEQAEWLRQLRKKCEVFQFDHITEHFGFMTGKDFHQGAPISIPFTASTLAIGRDRLLRIQEACECPVGLENLAFSYSLEEVKRHGSFLDQLLDPVNGFIILDLHNVYCQLHNFQLSAEALLPLYPLHRVREIHISGGSWEDSMIEPGKRIRRDTHDDSVPQEVFHLLQQALPLCPNLKYVVLEQLGNGLETEESVLQFQADFDQMKNYIEQWNAQSIDTSSNAFTPVNSKPPPKPLEDLTLHAQQSELTDILENASDYQDAYNRLQASSLAQTAWGIESWKPAMLETVLLIAQKWKHGFYGDSA